MRRLAGRIAHPLTLGRGGTLAVALAIVLVSWAFMVWDWEAGRTITFAVAGLLPVSDASGYFGCASGLIDFGRFADAYAGWCGHRPIYLGLLASLLAFCGRYLQVVLLVQAAVLGVSLAVLAREMSRLAGAVGALLAVAVLWAFAVKTCFLTTTTETAGLAFGALALALLLCGAERGSRAIVLSGIALLSIALNARAGALFVLPLLVLWSGVFAWQARLGVWRMMAGAVLAVVVGFAVEYLLVAAGGSTAGAAHSDFAYTLYGLAVGGKSWAQLAIDHPEIAALPSDVARSHAVYRLAFEALRQHPFVMVGALARNFAANLVDTATFGIGTRFGQSARLLPLAIVAAVPWIAGIAAIVAGRRDPRRSLLGAFVLGGLASGAVIVQDGGVRIFAATLGGDALVAGLGLAAILRRVAGERETDRPIPTPSPLAAAGLALLLLVLTAAPFTPALRALALPALSRAAVAGPDCAVGEQSMLVRPGSDSPVLIVPAEGSPSLYPPRVPAARFGRAFDQSFWFAPPFRHAPPATYVLAYQRQADAGDRGAARPLVWSGDLTPYVGRAVRFCVTRDGAAAVPGLVIDNVTSVTPLD